MAKKQSNDIDQLTYLDGPSCTTQDLSSSKRESTQPMRLVDKSQQDVYKLHKTIHTSTLTNYVYMCIYIY